MSRAALVVCVGVAMVAASSGQLKAQQVGAQPESSSAHVRLEQLAKRTSSLQEFGRAVSQQILLSAAKERRERGGKGPLKVTVTFDVTELPMPPGPQPGPDIDVCALMCSDWSCYLKCSGPEIGGGQVIPPPLFDRCEQLRRQDEQLHWQIMIECFGKLWDKLPPKLEK